MEEKTRKRIAVEIGGSSLTLVTDESESFVRDAASRLDDRLRDIMRANGRINALDAALLCAVEYSVSRQKAEKRVRTLEAQLSISEESVRSLREELARARDELSEAKDALTRQAERSESLLCPDCAPSPIEENGKIFVQPPVPVPSVSSTKEEKIHALEAYLDERENELRSGCKPASTREEKIRYIESLLRSAGHKARA